MIDFFYNETLTFYESNGEKKLTKIISPGTHRFRAIVNKDPKPKWTTGRGYQIRDQLEDAIKNFMNRAFKTSGKWTLNDLEIEIDGKLSRIEIPRDLLLKYKIQ